MQRLHLDRGSRPPRRFAATRAQPARRCRCVRVDRQGPARGGLGRAAAPRPSSSRYSPAADAPELGIEPDAHLPAMPLSEQVAADYQMTRLSLKDHPMTFLRPVFAAEGVLTSAQAAQAKDGRRAKVAGIVLVRQRPGKGNAIFVTIEDETGITNGLIWARDFEANRRAVMASAADGPGRHDPAQRGGCYAPDDGPRPGSHRRSGATCRAIMTRPPRRCHPTRC